MKTEYRKIESWFFCITLCLIISISGAFAQQNVITQIPPDIHRGQDMTQFFSKAETVGSVYLTRNWVNGKVELSSHKILPEPGEPLLFNFDKINNVVYTINRDSKIVFYPADSVLSFNLVDNNTVFSFEKVPWISDNFFLVPILKSEKGYSLYKRLFTRLLQADFSNEGYYSKGRKFDEYIDYYEYYITYPGNNLFRKLYLKEKDIRRALRDETKLLDDFFTMHEHEINEQSLIGIVQFINDKKFPE
ncbi:MAG TPA: hypothetical protein VHT72_05755 [Puia sp.]|nr:hypothetical protein [Puia sp.]